MNNDPQVTVLPLKQTDSHKSLGWQNPLPDIIKHIEDESNYFVQGGNELNGKTISKLDRTITFRIQNTDAVNTVVSVMFGRTGSPNFDPDIFGLGIITMPDLGAKPLVGQNQVRNELITNGFLVSGIKLFYPNATPGTGITAQQAQPLTFRDNSIYGKTITFPFQTLNQISPTNANNQFIDVPDAGITVDSNVDVLLPILPLEEVWVYYTIKARLNSADFLFKANPVIQESTDPRPTGNPIYDLSVELSSPKEISDCQPEYQGITDVPAQPVIQSPGTLPITFAPPVPTAQPVQVKAAVPENIPGTIIRQV